MAGYLIAHPRREGRLFGATHVYFDGVTHNQDPYIWSRRFLHTACHITQMSPEVGHTNFWVSTDGVAMRSAARLVCDLVFAVQEKLKWAERNRMSPDDPIVDSPEAFQDHYGWYGSIEHPWKRGTRHTLKADSERSFQPQADDGSLIDVVPGLKAIGLQLDDVRQGMRAGFNTRPYRLNDSQAADLLDWISKRATIKLRGEQLREIRLRDADQLAGRLPIQP